jgi:hypothetical protein
MPLLSALRSPKARVLLPRHHQEGLGVAGQGHHQSRHPRANGGPDGDDRCGQAAHLPGDDRGVQGPRPARVRGGRPRHRCHDEGRVGEQLQG